MAAIGAASLIASLPGAPAAARDEDRGEAPVLQGKGPIPEPKQFGTTSNWSVIPVTRIVPVDGLDHYAGDWVGVTYYRWNRGGGPGWYAADLDLPPGAEIEYVCLYIYDNDPNANMTLQLMVSEMGASTNGAPTTNSLGAVSSSGSPGYTSICAYPSSQAVVRTWGDANGNGYAGTLAYWIKLTLPAVENSNIRWSAAGVQWHRKISPAPGSPSFGDVPTNHPFYQAIEALKAAGVTSGCGSGNYCPESAVTRGQMAAFLAKALGLSWPY
jgi:hypothetical protein